MRTLLLARPFALMPLSLAIASDHDHDHGSLDKHEHGASSMNIALDGNKLEIELESPAMNIVGFEHEAKSAQDQATLASARAALEQPLTLIALPAAAQCVVKEVEVESPLFGNDDHDHAHHDHSAEAHSDIDADYELTCSNPEALDSLSLAPLFKAFPGTTKIAVQLIGPNGQQGAELTATNPSISF